MTLQIINSTTAGATQDLSTRVFMASDRLGLPPFSITQNAEEGSVGMSTLVVDDPSGNLTLKGHRRVYFVETSAPAGQQVIGNTYVGIKTIDRGDWNVGPLARSFSVSLADANTLISRRIVVGADGNRPAETDVQRVQWLLTTTEANEFNGSSLYVNTVGPIAMDAVDYRGQSIEGILNDCSQASGKNYWIVYFEALGQFGLWYDFDYSETYDSTIRLSNDEADIDDSTTFAPFPTTTLTQDPSRVYSGVYMAFDGSPGWIYETDIATGNEFVFRDTNYSSWNVKSEAKARARARRYLDDIGEEDEVIRTSFVVPAAKVNAYMHGHRIPVKYTHFTGYTTFTWMRGLNRTVTQLSPSHYRIDSDLSPINVETPCTVDEQYTFSTAGGLKKAWAIEVTGVVTTPVDAVGVSADFAADYNPDVGDLTLGGGVSEAMLLAGYMIGNGTDSDGPFPPPPMFDSADLDIDYQEMMGSGGGGAGDLVPYMVFGHKILSSPSAGSYGIGLEYIGPPMAAGGNRFGGAGIALVSNGDSITIVQSKSFEYGVGTPEGVLVEFDSPQTAGSLIIVLIVTRVHATIPAPSAWVRDEFTTFGPGSNYGALFYHEVTCP